MTQHQYKKVLAIRKSLDVVFKMVHPLYHRHILITVCKEHKKIGLTPFENFKCLDAIKGAEI